VGEIGRHRHLLIIFFFLYFWKRYYYYLTNGIRKDMIAPEDEDVMVRIYKLIPKTLLTTPALEPLQVSLRSEKESDYYYSLMKSIGKAGLQWARGCLSFVFESLLCNCRYEVARKNQFKGGMVQFVSWLQRSAVMSSYFYCFYVMMEQNITQQGRVVPLRWPPHPTQGAKRRERTCVC